MNVKLLKAAYLSIALLACVTSKVQASLIFVEEYPTVNDVFSSNKPHNCESQNILFTYSSSCEWAPQNISSASSQYNDTHNLSFVSLSWSVEDFWYVSLDATDPDWNFYHLDDGESQPYCEPWADCRVKVLSSSTRIWDYTISLGSTILYEQTAEKQSKSLDCNNDNSDFFGLGDGKCSTEYTELNKSSDSVLIFDKNLLSALFSTPLTLTVNSYELHQVINSDSEDKVNFSSGGYTDFSFNAEYLFTDKPVEQTPDIEPTTVPEPSTLAIFIVAIIGLASRKFNKQS